MLLHISLSALPFSLMDIPLARSWGVHRQGALQGPMTIGQDIPPVFAVQRHATYGPLRIFFTTINLHYAAGAILSLYLAWISDPSLHHSWATITILTRA
ncbi:hypothetical protein P152DRAFT_147846 [Eremomyces bilateralis CBS 781.70]|uniref:Uncharacterized protein n=1 Tax=Eremomyces bilateralis CBS 781.70 TaxID=1392243 RepID=A0A6G1FVT7_9PEZI|nr:uncharacterized protein P152DRAFT_147846 [Eremomyces bilateralis CBS 781.70]KAF1809749.1 hypothetical protein P152DRAFT_147846 [Eremomyces bilateralis CBS 781.70]